MIIYLFFTLVLRVEKMLEEIRVRSKAGHKKQETAASCFQIHGNASGNAPYTPPHTGKPAAAKRGHAISAGHSIENAPFRQAIYDRSEWNRRTVQGFLSAYFNTLNQHTTIIKENQPPVYCSTLRTGYKFC
jgi:hypothetical protein